MLEGEKRLSGNGWENQRRVAFQPSLPWFYSPVPFFRNTDMMDIPYGGVSLFFCLSVLSHFLPIMVSPSLATSPFVQYFHWPAQSL